MRTNSLIYFSFLLIFGFFVFSFSSCKKDDDDNGTNGSTQLKDADNNVYKTVKIGNQTWMAENLKTTKFKDGSAIPNVSGGSAWGDLLTPGYCWYNNDKSAYGDVYGALYNWHTVSTGNLCPAGWRVPTDADWATLTSHLGGDNAAGGKLKESGNSYWQNPNAGASNESGFTALPGGNRQADGAFDNIGTDGFWWSSTSSTTIAAFGRMINYNSIGANKGTYPKKRGFSVRCVKE